MKKEVRFFFLFLSLVTRVLCEIHPILVILNFAGFICIFFAVNLQFYYFNAIKMLFAIVKMKPVS